MDLSVKKRYMIFNIVNAVTKDNRPYLRLVMTDTEGSAVNGIMFDCNKLKFTPEKSHIVDVSGLLQQYNGVTQLKISDMEHIEGVPTDEFMPRSDKDINVMLEEFKRVLNKHVQKRYLKELVDLFLNDEKMFGEFIRKPAAKSVHHAYLHGLLEHTLSMIKLCAIIADYYGNDINKELLVVGALFHDAGKVLEIDSESVFDYTDEGRLLGHLLLGINLVNGYIEKIENFPHEASMLIVHLIASHHGYLEFGSPKRPKTKEALILHFVDNMDAKLATLDSIFDREEVPEGGWSIYDKHMERPLYRPRPFPED